MVELPTSFEAILARESTFAKRPYASDPGSIWGQLKRALGPLFAFLPQPALLIKDRRRAWL